MNLLETFIGGLRKGAKIGACNLIPTIVAAFAVVQFLNISHVLDVIGQLLAPLMIPFGLPGEAITVIICSWLTTAGAIGMTAGMYASGNFTSEHVAIVLPAILLIGSQIQYIGRILAVAGLKNNYIVPLLIISFINALIAMLMMRYIIL